MSYGFVGHPTDPNVGLPPGWIARFDNGSQHWFYVDTNSGRTQWDRPASYGPPSGPPPPQQPQQGYSGGGGYGGGNSSFNHDDHYDQHGYHKGWGDHQDKYAASSEHKIPESKPIPPKQKSNWGKYAALGAGGVLGGILLDHEANKIEDKFDNFKYDVEGAPQNVANWAGQEVGQTEQRFDNFEQDVEYAPENLANWAGEKVGKVEGKWDNLEQDVDNFGNDIVDAPENLANWVGGKVGEVEQFGDNIDNAYDDGVDEGRAEEYDDDY
ncbi:hypothetical protein AA313_de0201343 [Arthrobotrys entomopaga]|nr:hypothetical protein AA313_de0201343 [Arthrobotrys entomopaga]